MTAPAYKPQNPKYLKTVVAFCPAPPGFSFVPSKIVHSRIDLDCSWSSNMLECILLDIFDKLPICRHEFPYTLYRAIQNKDFARVRSLFMEGSALLYAKPDCFPSDWHCKFREAETVFKDFWERFEDINSWALRLLDPDLFEPFFYRPITDQTLAGIKCAVYQYDLSRQAAGKVSFHNMLEHCLGIVPFYGLWE